MITKKELLEGTVSELAEYISENYLVGTDIKPDSELSSKEGIQKQIDKIAAQKETSSGLGSVFVLTFEKVSKDDEITVDLKLITIYIKVK